MIGGDSSVYLHFAWFFLDVHRTEGLTQSYYLLEVQHSNYTIKDILLVESPLVAPCVNSIRFQDSLIEERGQAMYYFYLI